jgi:hypothetical protein
MNKKWLMAVVLACVPALVMAQSVVCAGKIIRAGTTRAEVSAKCGDPAQVEHKSAYGGATTSAVGQPNLIPGSTVELQIELWTYNFGPRKLMQRIRFEDGIVVRVESLGYGY